MRLWIDADGRERVRRRLPELCCRRVAITADDGVVPLVALARQRVSPAIRTRPLLDRGQRGLPVPAVRHFECHLSGMTLDDHI